MRGRGDIVEVDSSGTTYYYNVYKFDIRFVTCHIYGSFSDIMSDSSILENGKEFSEMQKVTLLLHMMEHLVFPDAKLTREIKLKTIEYAKDIMGLEVHMSSLEKLLKTWKEGRQGGRL